MPSQGTTSGELSLPQERIIYGFDEAAKGLAGGTISRRQALKLTGSALLGGGLLAMFPEAAGLTFMTHTRVDRGEDRFLVSRSGYTGEDGYELLIPADLAAEYWERLLDDPRVKPIGLGARDSLRLEAGLPLYGHDADETTSPIEAGLAFAVSKRRRAAGDFPGAARIERELSQGPSRVRVGLTVEGAPAREGAEIAQETGTIIGKVTSGGFSPTLGRPIAMGYVPPMFAKAGFRLKVIVRGKPQTAIVTDLPFVPHRYVRKI